MPKLFARDNLIVLGLCLLAAAATCEVFFRLQDRSVSRFDLSFPAADTRAPVPYTMFNGLPNVVLPDGEALNANGYRGRAVPATAKPAAAKRVFVLGGSTVFEGQPPLAEMLEIALRQQGLDQVEVYNYGSVSANSTQETVRLALEVLQHQPDLIISYNGGNDIHSPFLYDPRPGYPYNFVAYEMNPFLNPDSTGNALLGSLFKSSAALRNLLPGTYRSSLTRVKTLQEKVGFGSPAWQHTIASIYLDNMLKTTALAKAYGAKHVVFFQPTLYTKPTLTPEESAYEHLSLRRHDGDIRNRILALATQTPYNSLSFHNLGDVFAADSVQRFTDTIHITQQGREAILSAMLPVVAKALQTR